MKRKIRQTTGILMTAIMLCGLSGCGNGGEAGQTVDAAEAQEAGQAEDDVSRAQEAGQAEDDASRAQETEQEADASRTQENSQGAGMEKVQENSETDGKAAGEDNSTQAAARQETLSEAYQGGDLDVIEPDPAEDDWYRKGRIFTDEKGRRLEVFFNDEGMLEFAIDGLSVYFSSVTKCQLENNWRIYTCDDGTLIAYYPGDPAHIEICDGDYAGLYEAGGDKVK